MKIKAWAILTTGLAEGYELTKSPARVQAARENGQTVVELKQKTSDDLFIDFLNATQLTTDQVIKRLKDYQ